MEDNSRYTLITGASKGIGRAFAIECAQRNMNLILIARNNDLLVNLKELLINTYHIKVEYLAIDLTLENSCIEIFQFVNRKNISINILINNAGSGYYGNFGESNLTKNIDVVKLNIEVCLKLTHQFIANCNKSEKCYLLNVLSTGAFQPIPNLAVYAASKSFLLSFTKSIQYEQKASNLFISALCPGGTDSDFAIDAKMGHVFEQNKRWLMTAAKVASIGIKGLLSHKKIIIPGFHNKLHIFLTKIIPEKIILFSTAKIYK